nr:hypothetical protein [Cressdnaviricota sp.]UOF79966.1 hypothetical protein [Cressdnaviricota sp.]
MVSRRGQDSTGGGHYYPPPVVVVGLWPRVLGFSHVCVFSKTKNYFFFFFLCFVLKKRRKKRRKRRRRRKKCKKIEKNKSSVFPFKPKSQFHFFTVRFQLVQFFFFFFFFFFFSHGCPLSPS